jgi:methyl-accepting chemotaxis protein
VRNRSISKKLFAGFASIVLTAVVMDMTALWAANTLNRHVDQLAGVSGRTLQLAADVRFLVADLKARERLVVIAAAKQDVSVMQAEASQIKAAYAKLQSSVEELRQTTLLPRVREDADGISRSMASWSEQWAKTERFAVAFAALDAADSTDAGRRFSDEAADLAGGIGATASSRFADDRASAAAIYSAVRAALIGTLAVTLALGGVVGLVVRRISTTLVRSAEQLRGGSELVLDAAGQVAGSAQTLSRGVQEEAAALEETSASMEAISSMTTRNAEHAQDAARLMVEAEAAVGNARSLLGEMVDSMAEISAGSRKVSDIIKAIDEIAFQTNILALNAAVEAARAGAAGSGFAVVADEVRNLAQRSARAATNTSDLIEESIARSDRGVVGVGKVSLSMQDITGAVAKLKKLIDQISEASREQAHGFVQVSQALAQMERMTQSNAAAADASSAAGDDLTTQARASLVTAAQLESLVGTTRASSREPRAGPAPPRRENGTRPLEWRSTR